MKNTMQFDFIVDKEKNTMTIRREFAAGRQLVWDCHTKPELLDQWFAPKPFSAKTKHMSFKEGGYWLYAMVDPDGKEFLARADYEKIHPINDYTLFDAFCNDDGSINKDLPRAKWDVTFYDRGESSLVQTIVQYKSLADLEQVVAMGMKEGLTMTMQNLDELIASLTK